MVRRLFNHRSNTSSSSSEWSATVNLGSDQMQTINAISDVPPIEVSDDQNGECQLTENDVDLLMDALDNDDDESSTDQPEVMFSTEPLPLEDDELRRSHSDGAQSRYSFSLPTLGVNAGEGDDDDSSENDEIKDRNDEAEHDGSDDDSVDEPSEDAETEPASCSDEPATTSEASRKSIMLKRRYEESIEASPTSKSLKLSSLNDNWNGNRAIPDSSLGLLNRVDTR